MAKQQPVVISSSDLRSLGLSRAYAWELANRKRKPSRDLAVRIERALGVPVAFWSDEAA